MLRGVVAAGERVLEGVLVAVLAAVRVVQAAGVMRTGMTRLPTPVWLPRLRRCVSARLCGGQREACWRRGNGEDGSKLIPRRIPHLGLASCARARSSRVCEQPLLMGYPESEARREDK